MQHQGSQIEWPFRSLSNDALVAALFACRGRELATTVEMLRLLEEVDRRQLYSELGHPSCHAYCVEGLHFSESEAYLRITVARLCRRFPVVFEMVARGELHLSGAAKLGPHLTEANHAELLREAVHRTKRQIERLIAVRFPEPDVSTSIRKVPPAVRPPVANEPLPLLLPPPSLAAQTPASSESVMGMIGPKTPSTGASTPATDRPGPQRSRPSVEPLSADRYSVRFTASARCKALMDRAAALSSHRRARPDLGEFVEEALELLVEKLEKQKFKTTTRPQKRAPAKEPSDTASNEHAAAPGRTTGSIPAEVKRTVYARDEGRCTYVSADGHRCGATHFLEFDHRVARARGGPNTADNIRLLCRTHNQLAARKDFGDELIDLFARGFRPVPPARGSTAETPSGR